MGMFIFSFVVSIYAANSTTELMNETMQPNSEILAPNPVLNEESHTGPTVTESLLETGVEVESDDDHKVIGHSDEFGMASSTTHNEGDVETGSETKTSEAPFSTEENVELQTDISEVIEGIEVNDSDDTSESRNKPVVQIEPTMEESRDTIGKFLVRQYGVNVFPNESFDAIWRLFEGDLQRIMIFLTHCMHNTSGFQNLTGHDNPEYAPYISRGILQITGVDNYEIAGEKYTNNPELMASCGTEEVEAAVRVYLDIVPREAQYTFYDSLKHLRPEEVQADNHLQDCYKTLIENRATIYRKLAASFDREPIFGDSL